MKREQKSMGNKGFSLVELIIVIAIMAVLMVVLAPQYLKFVEKSRISADGTTANEFIDALQVAASDVDLAIDSSKTYSVTANSDGDITISDDTKTVLANYMDTTKNYKFQSETFKKVTGGISITMSYDTTNQIWKVEHNVPDTTKKAEKK